MFFQQSKPDKRRIKCIHFIFSVQTLWYSKLHSWFSQFVIHLVNKSYPARQQVCFLIHVSTKWLLSLHFTAQITEEKNWTHKSQYKKKSLTFPSNPSEADRFHEWESEKKSRSSNQPQFHW